MKRYKVASNRGRYRRAARRLFIVAALLLVAVIVGSVLVHKTYGEELKPVSDSAAVTYVTVASGTPPSDIAELLHDKGLIRSVDAFQWYITSHNQRDKLQAGTYRLSPNMSTPVIAGKIAKGQIATDLVTIVPGQTLMEIRKTFIKSGFKVTDVDSALRVENYASHPALADNPVFYARAVNDTSYDTTDHAGLPPGPIASVSSSSLGASSHPAGTDWLYFVAGDDGTTYFSHTFEEHQQNIAKYCHKLCSKN
jgi:cell division protein YceG involved in septum cleavage